LDAERKRFVEVSPFGITSYIRGLDEPFPAKSFINEEKQLTSSFFSIFLFHQKTVTLDILLNNQSKNQLNACRCMHAWYE